MNLHRMMLSGLLYNNYADAVKFNVPESNRSSKGLSSREPIHFLAKL